MNLFQVHPVGTTILNLAGVGLGILDALGDRFGFSPALSDLEFHNLLKSYQLLLKSQALTSTFSLSIFQRLKRK
jgi:hypothetical protein